jgi:prolyl-tRNA editing enzyme YbaK/EbsC (Cys-tRNA(Pro) deacylase)
MTANPQESQDSNLAELGEGERERLLRLRQILDRAGVPYRILAHEMTVVSALMGVEHGIGSIDEMAPTLILKSEHGLLAAIISGSTRLSYRKIKRALGVKDIALASAEIVKQATGAAVGTVSLVNGTLPTIIDSRLAGVEAVYGGCGVPRHTLYIRIQDLVTVTGAQVFDFTEPRLEKVPATAV